ncbi:MAG: hypothetical protein BMS9Abin02_1354 [Anaerolineae bacterium]|nr:MAG: hypothetical protein BMS9Abin02_1354 [Anaerolineae bacterium]
MLEEEIILNSRYKLIERAGTGGMAVVYKGQDLMLGRMVAIKILHESLVGDEQFLQRFQKEAHSAANLSHPNIVTVHDIGQDGHRYYIVMELVEGSTLKELIRDHGKNNGQPMPLHQAVDIAIQICAGVGYAHRARLIHCDMKSQNVLVSPDNQVKVTDFGIARALSEASLHEDSQIWGTPQYFSPEQAAGLSPTTASDVYSIGVILFEMLAGKLPFKAGSHTALALKHIQEPPPNISTLNPAVPDQLARVVEKVLSKEPSGRYRTADQLGRVLKVYRDNSEEETGPVNRELAAAAVMIETTSAAVSTREAGPTAMAHTRMPEVSPENSEQAEIILTLDEKEKGTDWLAVILGIIALISLLGLIPLWYSIYRLYTG